MTTRLSFKAQKAASAYAEQLDILARQHASLLAEKEGKEFADETHVDAAYKMIVRRIYRDIYGEDDFK